MKRLAAALAVLTSVALSGASAWAYVLRSDAVVEKMSDRRMELQLHALRAQGTLYLEGEQAKKAASALGQQLIGDRLQLSATIHYKMPGRCKVELESTPEGQRPSVANVNGQLRAAGVDLVALDAIARYACPLLYMRGGPDGEKSVNGFMRAQGIDPRVVKLGRANGGVAYVIGGKPRDTSKAQLWVDKDRFQPVRVVAPGASGGPIEVRLVDYGSPVGGEWHPRVIEVRRGETNLGKFVAERVEPNPKIDAAVF